MWTLRTMKFNEVTRLIALVMIIMMTASSLSTINSIAQEGESVKVTYYILRDGIVKPSGETYLKWNAYWRVGYGTIKTASEIYDDISAVSSQIIEEPMKINRLEEGESIQWYTIRKTKNEWRVEGVVVPKEIEAVEEPIITEEQKNAVYYILDENIVRPSGDSSYFKNYYYDVAGYGTVVAEGSIFEDLSEVKASLRAIPEYSHITTENVEWYAVLDEDDIFAVYGQRSSDIGTANAYPATFYKLNEGVNYPVVESDTTWEDYRRIGYGSVVAPQWIENDISTVEAKVNTAPDITDFISGDDDLKWYSIKTEQDSWRVEGVLCSEIELSKDRVQQEAQLPENGEIPDEPLFGGEVFVEEPLTEEGKSFIYTEGQGIYNQDGSEYQIKSIGLGNNVWYTQNGIPVTDHDEQSFEELAMLGFNSVRFYMNASLFETAPYTYNEEAFDWLDDNIDWARKNGMTVLLNMHIPQGGQLNTHNVKLWTEDGYTDRFAALWYKIAERYADDDAVLGYGLMNEPFVPELATPDQSLDLYYDYIEVITKMIRTVDTNHMLFIERPYAVVNTDTDKAKFLWGYTESFRQISDNNTVYEFHFYDKNEFIYQGLSWLNYKSEWIYNTDNVAILRGSRNYLKNIEVENYVEFDPSVGDWQYVESKLITIEDSTANYGHWMVYGSQLGKESVVNVDNLTIKEYDELGNFVRNIYTNNFDDATYAAGWNMNTGGGSYVYDGSTGYYSSGSTSMVGVDEDYRYYLTYDERNHIPLKTGYSYQIVAMVKGTNVDEDGKVYFSLQTARADHVFALDKEFLRYQLEYFTNYGKANNVAMYLGEFGAPNQLMGNHLNGEDWVLDMFELIDEFNLSYSYHDYHEENFGLYTNDSREERNEKNEILYKIFVDMIK